MSLMGFEELFTEADALREGATIAAAGGADATVVEALEEARNRGWVRPTLIGVETEIRALIDELGFDPQGFDVVDADEDDAARVAIERTKTGRADLLMKGKVSTPDLLCAVLDPETGLRSGRAICQVVLMEIVRDSRRFLLADTGIMIRPNLMKKIEIMRATVEVARALGAARPKVAFVAASETVGDAMPETIDSAEVQRRNQRGEFSECEVQGPLSFDLAYAAGAAKKKGIEGTVVGAADAMIFPGLASANLTVKAIMYTSDCRFGGVLMGTSHPVVFMSRADDAPRDRGRSPWRSAYGANG